MIVKDINQVFLKCHDNDFHNYYIAVLKAVYEYVNYFSRYQGYNLEKVEEYIKKHLNLLSQLQNDKDFPWEVKIYFNEEAKSELEKYVIQHGGNSECAYMDIESYLKTPFTNIDNYIINV